MLVVQVVLHWMAVLQLEQLVDLFDLLLEVVVVLQLGLQLHEVVDQEDLQALLQPLSELQDVLHENVQKLTQHLPLHLQTFSPPRSSLVTTCHLDVVG